MNLNNNDCVLQLLSLYVDELSFNRTGESNGNNPRMKFECEMSEGSDNPGIRLSVIGEQADGYSFIVRIVGVFNVESEVSEEMKDILLQKNAVAILFPYLRSQVSLLTTQPGLSPVLIPPVNIVKMFEDVADQEEGEEK